MLHSGRGGPSLAPDPDHCRVGLRTDISRTRPAPGLSGTLGRPEDFTRRTDEFAGDECSLLVRGDPGTGTSNRPPQERREIALHLRDAPVPALPSVSAPRPFPVLVQAHAVKHGLAECQRAFQLPLELVDQSDVRANRFGPESGDSRRPTIDETELVANVRRAFVLTRAWPELRTAQSRKLLRHSSPHPLNPCVERAGAEPRAVRCRTGNCVIVRHSPCIP